jgi:hypothetical protein
MTKMMTKTCGLDENTFADEEDCVGAAIVASLRESGVSG